MQTVSQKELAGHLGITTRQVRNLTEQGVLRAVAGDPRKGYAWPHSNRDYITFKAEEAVRKASSRTDEADVAELEKRKLAAETGITEMKFDREAGKLVPVEVFRTELEAILSRVRGRLAVLPGEYGAQVLEADSLPRAVALLRRMVESITAELRGAGRPADEEDLEEAA